MKETKVVFMGTPDFAVTALVALQKEFTVIGVVTQPDKPFGRGKKVTPPPVKIAAAVLDIPVVQPHKIRDPDFFCWLKELAPDYIVTAAYGKILPKDILNIPYKAALNIHASLLPAYRGSAPIHRGIINGEKESGVTIILMDEGMDTGDIINMKSIPIQEQDNTGTLHDKLAILGAKLIVEAIAAINDHNFFRIKQDDNAATYAPPLERSEERINWCADTAAVHNLIRGMNPWPGAYTELNGLRLKIWEGQPTAGNGSPCGAVIAIERDAIVIATGNGAYRIYKLQLPGKKIVSAGDFLRGNNIEPGLILGSYHAL